MSEEDKRLLTPRERRVLEQFPDSFGAEAHSKAIEEEELSGVKGWLKLFIILVIMSGLFSIFSAVDAHFESRSLYESGKISISDRDIISNTFILFGISSSFMYFFIAYRLLKFRNYDSVSISILFLWVAGPVLNFATFIIFQGNRTSMIDVLSPAIPASIWTLYLIKSVRVQNTYNSSQAD